MFTPNKQILWHYFLKITDNSLKIFKLFLVLIFIYINYPQAAVADNFSKKREIVVHKISTCDDLQAEGAKLKEKPYVDKNYSAPEGRFEKNGFGIIVDNETDLEWYVGPNKDISFQNASKWVRKLSVNGKGWRLPTTDELTNLRYTGKYTLYPEELVGLKYKEYVLGGCCPWTQQVHDAGRWSSHYVNFGFEEPYFWNHIPNTPSLDTPTFPAEYKDNQCRVMAVRLKR